MQVSWASGIAQVSAAAGYDVVLRDVTDEALERGLGGDPGVVRQVRREGPDRPRATPTPRSGRITTTTDLEAAADADLVVEAVFEKLEVKTEIFRALDRICKDGAVLASNTSAIPITSIAAVTSRPESVVGTHFFSPVPMMKLCELVRGYKTCDETLAAAQRVRRERRARPCVVVNRDVAGLRHHPPDLRARDGGRPPASSPASRRAEDIDTACRLGFGHAMGPLETADLTGVDIMLNATSNIYADTQDEKFAPPELLRRMVAAGDLGRKTGRGFYPLRVSVPTHREVAMQRQALADAHVRRALLGDGVATSSTGATSPRARPACRWPSTCRRRPATTPTTCWRAARSARSACRCRTSATCARCSTASRSAR